MENMKGSIQNITCTNLILIWQHLKSKENRIEITLIHLEEASLDLEIKIVMKF